MDEPIYKRSSFINLLKDKYTCSIKPINENGNVLLIQNGPAHKYMGLDPFDRIDYEEIYSYYKALCLEDLPSPSDLQLADPIILKKKRKRIYK